ncbi:hypothetical protein IMAU60212_01543 [Lactobacillus helveticus]|uniref:restriction endonuclease subunit S n=3 Tax=Bacillati TaxID=1783272 RepID=UPI0005D88988|nr:restriction endonuclease subunit S [Lactobacillus helveticus]AJY60672.1 hypothetical protein HUO_01105 [Lactobacillus helveticus]NRO41390.1 hypothetical protein [Lactobacillus helveticus]
MKLEEIKLGEVLNVKRGTSLSGKYYDTKGTKIRLTLGNFNYPLGGFKNNTSKLNIYFNGPVKDEFILKKGDIITPLTEQVKGLLGETARIPKSDVYIQSGDIGLLIPDEKKLDKSYMYHLISSAIIKNQLSKGAQQTKIRHTSPDKIKDCVAWIPDLNIQQKVGSFLDDIDLKIANNNAISKELESMAKTIYDYWFLQFEFPDKDGKPYKSNGGKMVWNDQLKQEIPEGWEVANLYRIAKFINGIACQKYRPLDNKHKLPVIKITEMHDGFTTNTEFVRDSISKDHIINNGDILFSWSASLETMIWNNGKGGLNQHIFKVIPKDQFSLHYVYQTLSSYIINFKLMAEARKTTMGHITKDHLEQSIIAIPPIDLIEKFEDIVKSFYDEITNVDEESQKLKSLRNFLLPLLMNGQVKIKN